MKRIITLLFSVTIFSAWTFAQPASKFNFSLALKLKNENIQNSEIAVFVQGDVNAIREKTAELGGVFKYSAGNIAAIRLPLNKVKSLSNLASVTRIENYDLKLQPMNDQVIIHNHAWEVQQGFNLPQGYDGSHVVIGIIDEGIDFTHPDFRNANGTTRIKYVWDQTYGPTAMSPQPYGYGREWKGSQIDTTVMHHDGSSSHGSHVAGIAAGNGLALNNYKGIAPNADIIVVKMNLNVPDNNFLTSLVDAVRYVFEKADSLNEPASINVSLGTYFGSHDGRDIQTIMIDTLISGHAGRSLTCAAGNAGSAPIHIGYNVTSDTSFTWLIAPYSPSTNNQVYVELWGDSANFTNVQFAMGIDRVQPAITSLAGIPFSTIQTNLGIQNTYTLYSGSNRLGIVETQGEYLHGAYTMAFLITPDSATSVYRWRLMTKGSGHLDGWSLDMVADNLPDSSVYPSIVHYKRPDLDQNIASSFTCSDKVITVGSYVNRNSYSNSIFAQTIDTTLVPGKLSAFSSHGPTRDGRIKPDINATGEWVLSCGSQNFVNALAAVEPLKVAAGKKHFRSSGTSMSSPVVAGIAALYLQRYPNATYADVKNAILACADQDAFTGSSLPDNSWGHGKVNAYAVIHGCLIGIDEVEGLSVELTNYPNPFSEFTTIRYNLSALADHQKAELKITDLLGKEVMKSPLLAASGEIAFSKNKLVQGIYFYSIVVDGKLLKTNKLVVL